MSGGHFDYEQYKIGDIADEIERVIEQNGRPIPWDRLDRYDQLSYGDRETYERDPYKRCEFSPEVIDRFKAGVRVLHMTQVYAQCIDWLLCGDSSEESFIKSLDEELERRNEKGDNTASYD